MSKEIIVRSPLFKGFNTAELVQLEQLAEQVKFNAGSTIFSKGEHADPFFYMVLGGAVNVMLQSGECEVTHGVAGIVGEIGPISQSKKRMRRVIAAENSTLLKWNLDDIESQSPELYEKVLQAMKDLAWERANPVVRRAASETKT